MCGSKKSTSVPDYSLSLPCSILYNLLAAQDLVEMHEVLKKNSETWGKREGSSESPSHGWVWWLRSVILPAHEAEINLED
jgi:hypothetical protein